MRPKIGYRGNPHFPISDQNNLPIPDQLSIFTSDK